MEHTLHRRPELQEFIIKTHYVKTHKSEKLSRPALFRLISHAEKLENLLLLLNNDHTENQTTIANIPSNIDVMKDLNVNLETVKSSNSSTVNELYVVI